MEYDMLKILVSLIVSVGLLLTPLTPALALSLNQNTLAAPPYEDTQKITLNIGGQAIPAVLYKNRTADDLLNKLPLSVNLTKSRRNYYGGITPLQYGPGDVQKGSADGELAYWIPGKSFVIFTNGNSDALEVPYIIKIGKLMIDPAYLEKFNSSIRVDISMAD